MKKQLLHIFLLLLSVAGFTACNCTLNYDEHRYINIREGRRHGHHGE